MQPTEIGFIQYVSESANKIFHIAQLMHTSICQTISAWVIQAYRIIH
jgi:hypothetical protein